MATQEEKKVDEKDTEQDSTESEDTEEESKGETEEDSEDDSSSQDEDIDYEALEKAEKDRAKPDPAKARDAFKKRKSQHEDDDTSADEDDRDRPMTRREAEAYFAKLEKQNNRRQALEIARANTSSEQEAQAAVTFYESRVQPTGNLTEDVLFAIGGLNYKKVVSKNKELARALSSRGTESKDSAGTHRDPAEGPAPKMQSRDQASYKRAGFSFDSKQKLYTKKLKNGKTLYKDPRTKRTWVQ